MANSIQIINKKSEIFNDLDLLVIIHLMIEEVSKGVRQYSFLPSVTDIWIKCCEQYAPGVIEMELDKIVSNNSMQKEFIELLSVIEIRLKEYDSYLPAESLKNMWRVSGVKIFDYKITLLLSAIGRLQNLIEG